MYENLLFQFGTSLLEKRFYATDVGKIHRTIPFDQLAALIRAPVFKRSGLGRKPWLSLKGGLALQFLKHYLQLSDRKLIERLNTDWSLQYFCFMKLGAGQVIVDWDLPSQWRSFIGQHLDIDKWQKVLASRWKPCMQQTQSGSQDATC